MKVPTYLVVAGVAAAGMARAAPIQRPAGIVLERSGSHSLVLRQTEDSTVPVLIVGRASEDDLNPALQRRQNFGMSPPTNAGSGAGATEGGGDIQNAYDRFTPAFVKQGINNQVQGYQNQIQGYQNQFQAQKDKVTNFFSNPFKWGSDKLKGFFQQPIFNPFQTAQSKANEFKQGVQNRYDATKAQVTQVANTVAHPVTALNNAVDQKTQQFTGQITQGVQSVNNVKQGFSDYAKQVQGGNPASSSSS